jgi:thermostable 8-oxoguanine DNA glycosylase
MIPATLISIGRAMAVALASSAFSGGVRIIAVQIKNAIVNNELETAKILLKDMSWRFENEFNEFIKKYKNDLPDDIINQLNEL